MSGRFQPLDLGSSFRGRFLGLAPKGVFSVAGDGDLTINSWSLGEIGACFLLTLPSLTWKSKRRTFLPTGCDWGLGTNLTPHNLRTLRVNNHAVRQENIGTFATTLKLEKVNEQLMARNALLEKELASVKATQALDKATRGSEKRQRYPEGRLFGPLYLEEHAEVFIYFKESGGRGGLEET
ncbi:hypothetical protein C356_05057 [Cryptococcus neoformans c45]|nr:hypothetical protein C356_05057 [Cryptococcus neoformans var. grubii c45]